MHLEGLGKLKEFSDLIGTNPPPGPKLNFACCVFHAHFLLGLLSTAEERGEIFL
jgi:hypothetical protein